MTKQFSIDVVAPDGRLRSAFNAVDPQVLTQVEALLKSAARDGKARQIWGRVQPGMVDGAATRMIAS